MNTTKAKRTRKTVTPEMTSSIVQMWVNKMGTCKEIARAHGVTPKTVFNVLERTKVRIRKQHSKRPTAKRVYAPRQPKVEVPVLTKVVERQAQRAEAEIVFKRKPGLFKRIWIYLFG